MIFGSVCSGIEAASVAWTPLGWRAAFFSEIEPFPCSVLAHHYGSNLPDEPLPKNGVPNLGDMTKFKDWPDATIDVLCGGTPCQSFSVAGLRQGLADPRGDLALTFLAIADRYRPRWIVWENVPGVLSSHGGRDFAAFLGALGQLGYGWAYRVLDAQFVRVDGYPHAVPQRRRRVFVVGHLGGWAGAAAVLFEPEGLRGHSPPRREAGAVVAGSLTSSLGRRGGMPDGGDTNGHPLAYGGNRTSGALDVATAVNAHGGPHGRLDFESETFVAYSPIAVAPTLGVRPPGTDVDTADSPIPIAFHGAQDPDVSGDVTHPVGRNGGLETCIAFDTTQITSPTNRSQPEPGGPCHPLAAGAHAPAIAFTLRGREGGAVPEVEPSAIAPSMRTAGGGSSHTFVSTRWAVRRLTPVECSRLQGYQDDYLTSVRHRGKRPADGPMYKALGNSWAIPPVRWIGQRIDMVEALRKELGL